MKEEILSYYNEVIKPYLTQEDDPKFWLKVFDKLLEDIELFYLEEDSKQDIFLQIGACSHWLRPHQTRLTTAGGFALPVGYLGGKYGRNGLPEFDWSIIFYRNPDSKEWVLTDKFFGKKRLVCRVALPTRTFRHNQAAINIFWFPGSPKLPNRKKKLFYCFKKLNGFWDFVDFGLLYEA